MLLALVLIIVIAAIYILQLKPQTTTDTGLTETEDEIVFEIGKPAPDFTLLDFEGNEHSLKDYKGKYVIVNLWASWCPFCIDEMPVFQKAYDKYKDQGLEIIAINRGENQEIAQTYAKNLNLTYPLLLNPTDDIAKAYQLRAMPTTYFLDKQGNLLEIKHGAITEEMFEELLRRVYGIGENLQKFMENEEEMILEFDAMENDVDIMVTDGVKHSVPLGQIRGGGPSKDGIPSIDSPTFVSVEDADEFVNEEGLGIGVEFDGVKRFYPFQILVWHEIVNDTVGDQAALITYCPLCGSGIVFDPQVNGVQTEFGTSGKLWNSNLVMYDRKTDSYWSQIKGEAIVGELTGEKLTVLPHDIFTYKTWKNQNPDGEVLSKETGHFRDYSQSPYGDYATNDALYFEVDNEDDRYHPKEPTFTIEINNVVKIYPVSELLKHGESADFMDKVGGQDINVEYRNNNKIRIYTGEGTPEIIPSYGFWFSVIAVYPDAEIYTFNN